MRDCKHCQRPLRHGNTCRGCLSPPPLKTHACPHCPRTCATSRSLATHISRHTISNPSLAYIPQPTYTSRPTPAFHKCDECKLRFNTAAEAASHLSATHMIPCRFKICALKWATSADEMQHYHPMCYPCRKRFVDEEALRMHITTHNNRDFTMALTEVEVHQGKGRKIEKRWLFPCLGRGRGCKRNFVSPEAVIMHLESGKCPGGISKARLDQVVAEVDRRRGSVVMVVDAGRLLGGSEAPTGVLTPSSEWSVVEYTPAISGFQTPWTDIGTPISAESVALSRPVISTDPLKCPLCGPEGKTFKAANDLRQHIESLFHAPRIYRCPNGMGGKEERMFQSLSGLVQHFSGGPCAEGGMIVTEVRAKGVSVMGVLAEVAARVTKEMAKELEWANLVGRLVEIDGDDRDFDTEEEMKRGWEDLSLET